MSRLTIRSALNTLPRATTTSSVSRPPLILIQSRGYAEPPRRSDGDLGGPGGSEVYPDSKPVHRKYTTATIAGVVIGVGALAMLSRRRKDKATDAAV